MSEISINRRPLARSHTPRRPLKPHPVDRDRHKIGTLTARNEITPTVKKKKNYDVQYYIYKKKKKKKTLNT